MAELTVLRLYFKTATARLQSGWKKLMAPALGPYLLQHAKEAGIHQAVLHRVTGGFLNDGRLTLDNSDVPSPNLPQCLELIGEQDLLHAFLDLHRPILGEVRVVLLRGEQVVLDNLPDSRMAVE